jgi:predicted metal-dependent hydrolase
MPKLKSAETPICDGSLHRDALRGLELFNLGRYFEAHEALETAWLQETGPLCDLYRGILQVAVVYLHITRHNYPGAVKVHQRCQKWLQPWPEICRGVDVGQLRRDLETAMDILKQLGPERIPEFDLWGLQPIRFSTGALKGT